MEDDFDAYQGDPLRAARGIGRALLLSIIIIGGIAALVLA